MAVIEAVVSVVTQKLTDMPIIEEPAVLDKVLKQVRVIGSKLEQKRGHLIGAEEDQGRHKEVKKWADNYLKVVYKLEDDIEAFAVALALQKWKKSHSTFGYLSYYCAGPFFFFTNLNSCRKLRRRMVRIGTKIDRLNDKMPGGGMVQNASFKYLLVSDNNISNSFKDQAPSHSQHHHHDQQNNIIGDQAEQDAVVVDQESVQELEEISAMDTKRLQQQRTLTFSYSYEEEESGIVGFQDDVNALVKRLITSGNGNNHNIVTIVCEVGSGKTTLAQAIYKSKGVKRYFQGSRAWVFAAQDYTKSDLLLNLLKQIQSSKVQDQGMLLNPEKVLADMLSSMEKKYLIVIDDVRTGDVWNDLKLFLESINGGSGNSKIILTTRDEVVANWPSRVLHRMKGIRDQESWKMFLKKARSIEEFSECEQNKQHILKICDGLPLRIVLLGGLLSAKFTKRSHGLSRVLNHICESGLSKDILALCYHDLPAHLKLCLLYLVLFPKELDISVRRLVRLWLAEGFVKHSRQETPEDVAEEYFDDLVNRNLIHIAKFRSDGSPRRCRLPSALHDYLLPKTQDIRLFHVHRSNSACNKKETEDRIRPRRIVEYLDLTNCNFNSSELQYLRSYISFNIQKKDIPAREVANFVSKIIGSRGFGLLSVLDLEGVYKPSLPDKLGVLFHLRYLGLRWTFLDNLPPSVGDLPHLETLDLKRTYINSLPNSIWRLKRLRHLNLNEIRPEMPEQQNSPLPGLLTLWGLFVDDNSLIKNGLSQLLDLRELGITFNLSSCSDLAEWISKLTKLQSLRLRSKDERGCPSKLHLKPLSALGKLSHLNLLGSLQKLPKINEFPPGLKVLTLSVSRLTEDPMPTLGMLPSLTVLRLLANSYLGEKIVCPAGGFGKLRDLKLWMLSDLKEWHVEKDAMPNLKELNIRRCDKLMTLPPQLLSTLEELILTNMPSNFVDKVRQQKSDDTYLTVKNWPFTSLPAEWEWKEDYI